MTESEEQREAQFLLDHFRESIDEQTEKSFYAEEDLENLLRRPLRAKLAPFRRHGLSIARTLQMLLQAAPPEDKTQYLLACVEYYLMVYTPRRNKQAKSEQARQVLRSLPNGIYESFTTHHNRVTGAAYEETFGLWLVRQSFEAKHPGEQFIYQHDSKEFVVHLPDGQEKKRRIDIYVPSQNFAVEVKSGRISLSRHVREQILKDEILLQTGAVNRVLWILFYGAGPATLDRLDKAGIQFFDCGWTDDTNSQSTINTINAFSDA